MQDTINNKVGTKKVFIQTWGWPYVQVLSDSPQAFNASILISESSCR
jgi:hypothetical protein